MKFLTLSQIILFVSAALLVGIITQAQFVPAPVSLTASPASPQPGSEVLIQAATPTFDEESAVFSWTIDGRVRPDLSGRGKDAITLVAGSVGSSLKVSVDVETSDGSGGSASLVVRVSDVVLTWIAETYTPPWYKGKTLPTRGSVVSVIAIPNVAVAGSRISPQSLIYRWSLDDQKNALSGAGEQVFRIQMSDLPGDSHRVEVIIEDVNREVRREERIFIATNEPKVVFYPSTPLGGIDPRAAAKTSFSRGLVDFFAEPFFFPVSSKRDLSYEWRLGASVIEGIPQNPWLITVDTGTESVGTLPLFATVKENIKNGVRSMGSVDLILE